MIWLLLACAEPQPTERPLREGPQELDPNDSAPPDSPADRR